MSPRLGVRIRAFIPAVIALMALAAPAFAQFYDDARRSLDLSLDPIERSPRLLGMGRLTLVGNDPHNRISLWDFAGNPTGLLDADSVSTFELRPGTASASAVHDLAGTAVRERQDLGARENRLGYEAWRRAEGTAAYGVAGEVAQLRFDQPYNDFTEHRSRMSLPSVMPVLMGRLPYTDSGKWLYSTRLFYSGESVDDEYRDFVHNAAGDYIDKDGTLLPAPGVITPDAYRVRTEGGGMGVAWKSSRWVTASVGGDLAVDDIKGTNDGDRHASEISEKRPYLNGQLTLFGHVGPDLEWGIDGHKWSAKSEQRWAFTVSAGAEAVPLDGRGKLQDRAESGTSMRSRVRWTHGSLELGAGLSTSFRKITLTPPRADDPTSFGHFRNVANYRPNADSLDLADSVTFNISEARAWEGGVGGSWRLPNRRGTVGIEYHLNQRVLDQLVAGHGPKQVGNDVRAGLEYELTSALSGRAGYQLGNQDLDDETEQNEFVTNTLTLGTGLHPVGARWSIDTGYAIQWRAADYGDPTQPHSSRQQLATQVRWAF